MPAHAPALDVLCAGEALWDLIAPRGASFDRARALRLEPGGAAVNAAIHLARLGLRVGIAATVGDDALGRALRERVDREGIDVRAMIAEKPRTGLTLIGRAEGARQIVSYRDLSAPPAPIPRARWARARVLLLTGLVPSDTQARFFREAAAHARRAGTTVVIDINARPRMWAGAEGASARVAAVLGAADVVKGSGDDLRALGLGLGDAAIGRIRAVIRRRAVLVITAGPEPARASGPFGELRSAPRPARALDPTGAGDAFTAGMIAALLEAGQSGPDEALWRRALARGHAAARGRLTGRAQTREAVSLKSAR